MKCFLLSVCFTAICWHTAAAGVLTGHLSPSPTPEPLKNETPDDGSRLRRERAYLKIMEGQRHLWKAQRLQTQAGKVNSMRLARTAFQEAIVIDSTVAEAYTALSELAVTLPPGDLDEAIRLASTAVKISADNLGGHRMLARLYTIKSRLNNGTLDQGIADQAVASWRQITRLDARNAEAWAFISAFSEARGRREANIEALRNWISSAPPLDVQFYARVMGGGSSLAPESASLKLASALAASGRRSEAVAILSALIADDADNVEAVTLLGEMLDAAEGGATIVPALQQAVHSSPENVSLIGMLARLQSQTGKIDDGIATLRRYVETIGIKDKRAAAPLYVTMGELYLSRDRYDEALSAYESALTAAGIRNDAQVSGDDREFAASVFEKLIHISKLADRPAAAKTFAVNARRALGSDDPFATRQLIMVLASTGERKEALTLVRSLREKAPSDLNLVRLEASLLADLGQIDSAVALIRNGKPLVPSSPVVAKGSETVRIAVPPTDEFSDLLYVSSLYLRANRTADAVKAANQALTAASGSERIQIAKMALATAQHTSGDHAAAESLLRSVLTDIPGNPMALNNLGYFLVERGMKLEEALGMIKEALKIDPKNHSYLDSLGWAYFKLGKLDEAEKYLKEAARGDADSSAVHEHLGDLYLRKGDSGKAHSAWTRALRLSTDIAETERLKKKLKN